MDNNLLLIELKKKLDIDFHGMINKIILFGSRVTDKATEYSDYDILIILKNDYDWKIEENIIDSSYEISLKYDIIIDIKVISINELKTLRGKQPYIINALDYGIAV